LLFISFPHSLAIHRINPSTSRNQDMATTTDSPSPEADLIQAITDNHPPDRIRELVARGRCSVNARASGETPLHAACRAARRDALETLLELRADANALDHLDNTPLHVAARRGFHDGALALLGARASVRAKGEERFTPLHAAVAQRTAHLSMIELLLEHRADVNARAARDFTPLHVAARSGAPPSVARELVLHGADLEAKGSHGGTALHIAASRNQYALTKMLVQLGADTTIPPQMRDFPAKIISHFAVADFPWTVEMHRFAPSRLRHAIKTMMLVRATQHDGVLALMPIELMFMIFERIQERHEQPRSATESKKCSIM